MDKEKKKHDFYYSYDRKLSEWLSKEKGVRYTLKAKSIKDGKVFCQYIFDENLKQLLQEWSKGCSYNTK